MNQETQERITSVEIKLSYMEDFVNKLQTSIVEHENAIDTLKIENKMLKQKIKELLENQEEEIQNRRPPHY